MPATSKPKPVSISKSAKSNKPRFSYNKYVVYLKTDTVLGHEGAESLAHSVTDYFYGDTLPEYVILDEDLTEDEFNAAWDAA